MVSNDEWGFEALFYGVAFGVRRYQFIQPFDEGMNAFDDAYRGVL